MPESGPIVYAITAGLAVKFNFLEQKRSIVNKAQRAADCGITHFQIREKMLPATLLLELAEAVVEAARGTGLKVLVNGRFDVALVAGADGVHLPADGLPVGVVRDNVPDGFMIAVSTHSIDDVVKAKAAYADMIVLGPVFESPGKGRGVGLENLHKGCLAADPVPVVALGGIDETNFRTTIEAGSSGIASIRFLNAIIENGGGIEF
jgi:thiamine-phosphate pyrophosphorylase